MRNETKADDDDGGGGGGGGGAPNTTCQIILPDHDDSGHLGKVSKVGLLKGTVRRP